MEQLPRIHLTATSGTHKPGQLCLYTFHFYTTDERPAIISTDSGQINRIRIVSKCPQTRGRTDTHQPFRIEWIVKYSTSIPFLTHQLERTFLKNNPIVYTARVGAGAVPHWIWIILLRGAYCWNIKLDIAEQESITREYCKRAIEERDFGKKRWGQRKIKKVSPAMQLLTDW